MTINIPLTAILLVAVAAAIGAVVWILVKRLGGSEWLTVFLALLVFGLILVFGHIT